MSERHIQRRRVRLLGLLALLCSAFAGTLVLFSFLEPQLWSIVQLAPDAARLGFLLLTFGLMALVWEQERRLERLEEQLEAERLERAAAEERDREALDYLRASHVVRARFLGTVSHELRTPLTSVLGFSETLLRHWDKLPEARKRTSLEEISSQSWKLWRLIERLLEAAQIELEGVAIEPKHHDVRLSLAAALQRFPQAEAERVEVDVPGTEVLAEVDPSVVEHLVSNLLDNALRFSDDEVRLQLQAFREEIRIVVRDRGPGISQPDLDRIMRPDFRSEEDFQSGTGLGLDVVKTLVADHHGAIDFSTGHWGTKATVRLPRSAGKHLPLRRRGRHVSAGLGVGDPVVDA